MSESFPSVLQPEENNRLKSVEWIVDFLQKDKNFVPFAKLIECKPTHLQDDTFARSALSLMVKNACCETKGSKAYPYFKLICDKDRAIESCKKMYIEDKETLPSLTQEYENEYGFERLVGCVSKWTNRHGNLEREYDIDRLWLMPYVEFLDRAAEWIAFQKSERALAEKEADKLKKQSNGNIQNID